MLEIGRDIGNPLVSMLLLGFSFYTDQALWGMRMQMYHMEYIL